MAARSTASLGELMFRMKRCSTWFLLLNFLATLAAGLQISQSNPGEAGVSRAPVGLAEGEIAPAFLVRDQFGNQQSLKSIAGKNGTVLLFFRSADW